MASSPNYSVYLITDHMVLEPSGLSLENAVAEALQGGVTMVQFREKNMPVSEMLGLAQRMKRLTRAKNVPLIIDDRVDVALAVDADGVHLGDGDMDIATARSILGPEKLIGATVGSPEEAIAAERAGANYLGTTAVWETHSKFYSSPPIGLSTLREIVKSVSIPVVAVGGVSQEKIPEVRRTGVAGVAVIRAILGAAQPREAARKMKQIWIESESSSPIDTIVEWQRERLGSAASLAKEAAEILQKVRKERPLIHHLAHSMAMELAGNVTLFVFDSLLGHTSNRWETDHEPRS